MEAEIADPNGNTVAAGEEGEIRVRGPNVCVGHYKNPDEQAKAFRDGWLYTGDVGRFDVDGYLYIVGRLMDFIKTGSLNVAPREVESVILGMAGIDDVAVVGISDPEWGEAVKAIVVVKDGYAIDKSDITRHCKQMLAGYKAPKYFEFTDRTFRSRPALGLGRRITWFSPRAVPPVAANARRFRASWQKERRRALPVKRKASGRPVMRTRAALAQNARGLRSRPGLGEG